MRPEVEPVVDAMFELLAEDAREADNAHKPPRRAGSKSRMRRVQ